MALEFISIYNASRALTINNELFDLKTKIEMLRLDIWFNKQCRTHNLTPNYINIKTNSNTKAAHSALRIARIAWLDQEIKQQYSKIQYYTEKLYYLHLEVGRYDYDSKFNYLFWKHDEILQVKLRNKRNTLCNKLGKLAHKHSWNELPHTNTKQPNTSVNKTYDQHKFQDRVVNISNTQFNDDEMDTLSKGHKFNNNSSYNDSNTIKNVIADCESIVQRIPYEDREHARHMITEVIKDIQIQEGQHDHTHIKHNRNQKHTIHTIKEKVANDKLIIVKADKGNTTVIMEANMYIQKTIEFLTENNATKIDSDPTTSYQRHIKEAIKNTHYSINQRDKKSLVNMNPSAPILKGYPKIHKPELAIRPIINFRTAPSYKLTKFLQSYLKNNYRYINSKCTESSISLANKLKDVKLNQTHRMLSLDVKNMFPSIPIDDTITLVHNNLTNNSNITDTECNEIIILLRLALKQNYCKFNGSYYSLKQGLPMGSPLSGILANIFMDNLENIFLEKHLDSHHISVWERYVDDIFLMYDSNYVTAEEILERINNEHPNINFTMETEVCNKLNHLDLTVTRINESLEINIYRKTTTTDHTIHATSNHPQQTKHAAYRFMINRMNSLPLSKQNIENETRIIKQIARANGFQDSIIDKLIRKTLLKKKQNRYNVGKNTDSTPYTSIMYVNSNTTKLTKMLRNKHNIKFAYAVNNTNGTHIYNNKIDKNILHEQSGVYRLRCQHNNCGATYVGQTGRKFSTRYKEHRKGEITHRHTSFSDHIYVENHAFIDIDTDLEVLHIMNKGRKLNTLEALEIIADTKTSNENLNDHTFINNNILFTLYNNKTR